MPTLSTSILTGTPEDLCARGKALFAQGKMNEARSCLEAALHFKPEMPEAWNDLGDMSLAQRHPRLAMSCYNEAIRRGMDPDLRSSQLWTCWMLQGDFEQAWEESDRIELRRKEGELDAGAVLPAPMLWDGTPFEGKDVALYCHHGYRDTVQFIRYAPLLQNRCRSLTVVAPPKLIKLLHGVSGIDRLVALEENMPEIRCDVAIESMELPYAFRTTLMTIPAAIPYIHAFPDLVDPVQRTIRQAARRTRVGLVWGAGTRNATRAIPLDLFQSLARVPDLALFSLQWGPEAEEIRSCPGLPILGAIGQDRGIAETASVILDLDLVISADTMTGHLAAALGKPVWMILPFDADWRWMVNRRDSPWYPGMRLFRQPAPGDWETPIGRLAQELTVKQKCAQGKIPFLLQVK